MKKHGGAIVFVVLLMVVGFFSFKDELGQFTRNYTQTVKRAADNNRRYAPGGVHSACLLWGFPKGAAPHLAHDFAKQSVVCYTLCRRCRENTVANREGEGHLKRQESRALFGAGKAETKGWFRQQAGRI